MTNWRTSIMDYVRTLVPSVLIALFIIIFVAQTFVVHGISMEPTLHNGERLIVEKVSYLVREPQRGDIIVFHPPAFAKEPFIKRVIGLPGDVVEVKDHQVLVNNQILIEEYLSESMQGTFGPMTVPQNYLFVLGDNRNKSLDSRYSEVGCISRDNVIGRAVFRYWPVWQSGIIGGATMFADNR